MNTRMLLSSCELAALAALAALVTWSAAAQAGPHVAKVENGGLLFTDNEAGVSGTDCGYSLPIGSRTLWFFGDVFLLSPTPDRKYVGGLSNCGLLVPAGRGREPLRRYEWLVDSQTGLARALIPNESGEDNHVRLWPLGGWYDSAHRRAYVYYGFVRTTGGGGPFDFRVEGHGLARANTENFRDIRFTRLKTTAGSFFYWPAGGPLFGQAVLADSRHGDYLYVFGDAGRSGKHQGVLARVAPGRIEDPSAYEYFAGSAPDGRWSRDAAEAASVEGLTDFPGELSVSYNRFLGGYLAVHSVGVDQRIRLSLADRPWGPYRTIGEIGAPHQAFAQAFCYAGKEHSELAEEDGRVIYITYVDNQRYWLQLLRVTLARE